jgi:hypothetical protein
VHWQTDRWIAPQQDYLRRHLPADFRIYAWLNDIPHVRKDLFYYHTAEPIAAHAIKLNRLADIISAATTRADDILIFLDGDAFPVADLRPLLTEALPKHKLVAVQRLENNGDTQPHPCFCATTVGFWRELQGDWREGHCWKDNDGREITDVGGNLLKQITDRRINWLPLRRTNTKNLHPLFFGIYGGVIYHHGAGFRNSMSRLDLAQLKLKRADRLWAKIFPAHKRRVLEQAQREMAARNDALGEEVFQKILKDPAFHHEFA